MSTPLPLIILAGRDGTGGPVPVDLREGEMLRGYKGAIPLPGGKALLQELIERLQASGQFEPILVLGPKSVYQHLIQAEIVDVSGNLPVVFETLRQVCYTRLDRTQPTVICTADILPTAAEISQLVEQEYRPHEGCSFWWQLVSAAREEMGQSDWKQAYRLRRDPLTDPEPFYPGHLVILRPQAIRFRLTTSLLALSYKYRNLIIRKRFLPMAVSGGLRLLYQDFLNLFRGQLPTLTWTVFYECLRGLYCYWQGELTIDQFAEHFCRMIVHRRFRQPGQPAVIFSPVSAMSWAKDIDSQRELDEVFVRLSSSE